MRRLELKAEIGHTIRVNIKHISTSVTFEKKI
jgi:hypothetical protein